MATKTIDEHMNDLALKLFGGDATYGDKRDITAALTEVVREQREAQKEVDIAAIPSNWIDPILTGPESALGGRAGAWGCPDIERLLNAVRERIRAATIEEPSPRQMTKVTFRSNHDGNHNDKA